MGIAIAAISLGVWLTYSALKGVSLADAFTGKGKTLDPSGSLPPAPTSIIDPSEPLSTNGTRLATGANNLDSMTNEMNRMIGLRQPYKWGGGHASFDNNGPWDCSGAVSWILHYMGMLSGSPKNSTLLMTWGESGRGKTFTVYANPTHVFIIMETGKYAGQAWGTTSRSSSQGGSLKWHPHSTAGFVARHREGW